MTPLASLRRTLCSAALVALLAVPLAAQETAPAAADPEARLIEGELLELAEGKVDEALEIYRALLAREELSPSLRARALFSIARAHRKRGELGAAKERYEELVAKHPDALKLVEAAHRYLEEIAEGAARLPEFDWVAEVEQNPQIQAQIFEWGMQLGGRTDETRKITQEAWRKLLALGVLVVPILEPMLEYSRDREHQEDLVRILIQLGRVQHIARFAELSLEGGWLIKTLDRIASRSRVQGSEILASLPPATDHHRWIAAVGRLYYERSDDLVRDVRTIAELEGTFGSPSEPWKLILDHIGPEGAARLRELLLPLSEGDFKAYQSLLAELIERKAEGIGEQELGPLLVPRESIRSELSTALLRKRPADLEKILEGPNAEAIVQLLRSMTSPRQGGPRTSPETAWQNFLAGVPVPLRARLLRLSGTYAGLLELALAEDEAIAEYERWLSDLADAQHPADTMFQDLALPGSLSEIHARVVRNRSRVAQSVPQPEPSLRLLSPAFEEAMRRVVETNPGVRATSLALENLAFAGIGRSPRTLELFRSVLADPTAAPSQRGIALLGAVMRLPEHEEIRGEVEPEIESAHASLRDMEWPDSQFKNQSGAVFPMLEIGSVQMARGTAGRQLDRSGWEEILSEYTIRVELESRDFPVGHRLAAALAPSVLLGRSTDLFLLLRSCYSSGWIGRSGNLEAFDVPLCALASSVDDAEALARLLPELWAWAIECPVQTAILRAYVENPGFSAEDRYQFLHQCLRNDSDGRRRVLAEIDWGSVLLGEDPLGGKVVESHNETFAHYTEPHRALARRSLQPVVRRWAWAKPSAPVSPDEVEAALADADSVIQRSAFRSLTSADDTRWLPLLHRAAREAPTDLRSDAIDRLALFAAEESLPVLTALLDDPVFAVRAKALEALEKIEATLSQQEKWRERFGKKKGER